MSRTQPDTGPTITATLRDGPLKGRSVETAIVQGRPPTTVESPAPDGTICRYVLEELPQGGSSAVYSFLYTV
jgi:hypothetical protein